MCPDTELLSAYYDDELDSVWAKKVQDHLAACPTCQGRIAHFAELTSELHSINDQDIEASMARSWRAIQEARAPHTVALWRRRVSIPVPALAAAAAVLVAAFGLGLFLNGPSSSRTSAPPIAFQPQAQMSPVDFQVNNMSDLLNYLNSKDLGTSVTIQLPKGVDRLSVGKPQLIRAADFNRGQ